jgi:DNA-binding transcriptional MocR family regulator
MDGVGKIAHLTHPGLLSVDPTAVIDKESPVPLHHQLELFLRQGIESGRFPPHETLPTEQELQEYFGLSRTPIRQAIAKLTTDGLVVRHRSQGTIDMLGRAVALEQGLYRGLYRLEWNGREISSVEVTSPLS